jgi:hypothetical protein
VRILYFKSAQTHLPSPRSLALALNLTQPDPDTALYRRLQTELRTYVTARMQAEIAQLRLALAKVEQERDRALEESAQHLEESAKVEQERDRALEESARALEESAQHQRESAQHQRALAKKDIDLKLVAANTIENIYTETDASGGVQAKAPPPLTLNNMVTPSLNGHERKGQTLAPADIHHMENEGSTSMWIQPDRVTVPIRDSEGGSLFPSKLGGHLGGGELTYSLDSLEYNNEVDIQQYVRDVVADAIRALGLGGVLNHHVEVALYGIIPDVIVVRVRGRVVFFVEVKCPDVPRTGSDETTVFKSEYVAGQVHSYLMAMLQHGNERPTGALMTYNKMCLVSLKDTKEDAERKTLIEKAIVKLTINWREKVNLESEPRHESCDPDTSLSRTQKELKALVQPYVANTVPKKKEVQDFEEEQDLDGKVSYSTIYQGAEIFPALLQALQLAYDDSILMRIEAHLPVARHDEPLGGRLFLKGNDESTKFVVTESTLKAVANDFPENTSKSFYLLAQLGTGKSGTTYLACDLSGRLCAC